MFRLRVLLSLLLSVILPASSLAVNFYDGARAPKGLYLLTYSSLYFADKTTDVKGKTSKEDYDFRKIEELLRFCYYTPYLVLTAFLPIGHLQSGFFDVSSQGIGDINLGAGYFLPVKQTDILPMLFVKFPTGEYDSQKSVNYGTNQYDIKPVIFLYKALGRFSIDAAVKYHFRTKNPSTNISPGNEVYLQCLLGWNITNYFKVGPSLNWMKSGNQKNNGVEVKQSERESFSLGGDVYLRLAVLSITLTYLRDLRSKNTLKGDLFQIKTCYKF